MIAAPQAQQVPPRPNIILIITDDVGYGDIGSYGAPDIKTPNIDGLARAGTRFTQFYANASSCTPTRAGLISGRYQQRFAIERPLGAPSTADGGVGLPATGRSLPQLLRTAGYATALIGKWHLGYQPQFSPLAHGFDSGRCHPTHSLQTKPSKTETFFFFSILLVVHWRSVSNCCCPFYLF